ncbi:hypothetical protein BDV30DRAFT_102793 [Aspergillus minisclerotigenes]|uniref:Uncharacterized protein n=1 Tax=Aspergillus minisclerotigenes TaxID=656917 RepID=A0A5N6JLV5_9EURO|nr:hypothetical protein BDV30DRAFT_102793 [Aspergillus minisclerotigenes]
MHETIPWHAHSHPAVRTSLGFRRLESLCRGLVVTMEPQSDISTTVLPLYKISELASSTSVTQISLRYS